MLARDKVFTIRESEVGDDPIVTADQFFSNHMGIHKLLVVDDQDRMRGLYTLSDIERIMDESSGHLKPSRDSKFRLLCGAAVSVPRDDQGNIEKDSLIQHVGEMVDHGLNLVAVSTAHGHTKGVGDAIRLLRDAFGDLPLMAGNVTTGEGVEFLGDAGANIIKIGQALVQFAPPESLLGWELLK